MKISYNWLKWYLPDLSSKLIQAGVPEVPEADKLEDIFTYHLCEVESLDKLGTPEGEDWIFDLGILPNRAHDLLSVHGVARELSSLLNIKYVDPAPMYKVPESKPTNLEIKVETENCRRYMARIVRNVKVGPSPEWVVGHLASIGQRSINNVVDAANIVMFDCGQPVHAFDLDKISGALVVRDAREGEEITTLDGKQVKLKPGNMVIADEKNVLAIAGVKGGKIAEVDENTKNIVIEIANFDPTSVRKTARGINIFTDAAKRFENDLSPTLCEFGMLEMSGLIVEYGSADFEEVIDIYPSKQTERKLTFSMGKVSKILGLEVTTEQIQEILNRCHFVYTENAGVFEIVVPPMRLDLEIEEDMAEEIGRILGYDKVIPVLPKINFIPKVNETYAKVTWARNKLLSDGYSEVMTYAFANKGEVEVLASASDKKFLRTNLKEGLSESIKINQVNLPLIGGKEVKVFEIGTVFVKNREEIHVCYGDKKNIVEISLEEFTKSAESFLNGLAGASLRAKEIRGPEKMILPMKFRMWSLFPFIVRDIAVWVPESEGKDNLEKILRDNMTELCIKGPDIFDSFTKPARPDDAGHSGGEGKTSYGFRLIFQSMDRTLTDVEVNEVMDTITNKVKENPDWQVR